MDMTRRSKTVIRQVGISRKGAKSQRKGKKRDCLAETQRRQSYGIPVFSAVSASLRDPIPCGTVRESLWGWISLFFAP